MDLFSILTMLGGLALFLFGMETLGNGLEKKAGSKLKVILARLTDNPFKGFLLGLGVTAVVQSSSATTVMVVGFVNSGIMRLEQAIGIIMGANVGTTATSWILSLTGIEGSSFFIQLLKPSSFSPILALIGIFLYMGGRNSKKKDTGVILLGFAVLMFGMETMSNAVQPLAEVPAFTNILMMFSNPLLGVLAGALLTAVIQSSSASVGILQALSATGSLTFGSAIPIIMGQNIGTCITAMLSSIGANKNAKRAAVVHLYFNVIGTVVFLALFYLLKSMIGFSFIDEPANRVGIAVVHTVFNVLATALMLPFTRVLEKLARLTIRDTQQVETVALLDDRLLNTPSFAVQRSERVAVSMLEISQNALFRSLDLMKGYSEPEAKIILELEDQADMYEDALGTYLVKLSSTSMSESDSRQVSKLLHCIGDFERISDHAVNIKMVAQEMNEKDLQFSDDAKRELDILYDAIREILTIAGEAFVKNDLEIASRVEPLEQVVDLLQTQLKASHIERLRNGECTTEMGFIFSDLTTNCERVADHCSNIAVCIIEISHGSFDTHEYLNVVKTSGDEAYQEMYRQFQSKYHL